MCDIFSNYFQLLKKRRSTMEECDDEFFESLVKKRRCSSHSEGFCKKGVLRNFAKFTGNHLCQSLVFDNEACNLFKNKTLAQVFLVNFAKFLRTLFLTEDFWWLLLKM